MKWLIALAALLLLVLALCLVITLVLFKKVVCRYPADPLGEDEEAPVMISAPYSHSITTGGICCWFPMSGLMGRAAENTLPTESGKDGTVCAGAAI